jgi:Ca2+-binding EF-hand superfamily protein
LQDGDANNDGSSDIWLNAWDFAYRDVVILDENNEYVAAYNLTNNDLANPINYATLEQMLVDAGEAIVTTEFEWQNSSNRFDVDADNSVAVIDVLRIVNRINLDGTGELPARTASDEYYFDVSGDGRINAVDVLQLVNEINRSFSGAQGESIDDAAEDELVGSIDLFSSDQVEDSDPLSDDWLI